MAEIQQVVKLANGQVIVLGEGDKVLREVTITCLGPRCASRNEREKPVSFTFTEEDFPEAGDSFMNLTLPMRSPSNPNNGELFTFCGPQCVRDFLVYTYVAPGPRQPEPPVTPEEATQIRQVLEETQNEIDEQSGKNELLVNSQADGYSEES